MASSKCEICSSVTKTKYRNVLCCESCKAFFRRTHLKEEGIRCPFAGKCEIETNTRKFCRACRLQKCYTVFSIKRQKVKTIKENNCDLLGQPLPTPMKVDSLNKDSEKLSTPQDTTIKTSTTIFPFEYQMLLNHLIQVQLFKNTELFLKQNFNNK